MNKFKKISPFVFLIFSATLANAMTCPTGDDIIRAFCGRGEVSVNGFELSILRPCDTREGNLSFRVVNLNLGGKAVSCHYMGTIGAREAVITKGSAKKESVNWRRLGRNAFTCLKSIEACQFQVIPPGQK